MFTGLVEEQGTVAQLTGGRQWGRLTLQATKILKDIQLGDSIAVNGVCLTVSSFTDNSFTVEIMAETLAKTNLGELVPGEKVNLERALCLSDRLGGHLVSGHVDGVGVITRQESVAIATLTEIKAPPEMLYYIVPKGSVAVDGVSLTVVERNQISFTVSLIPHTQQETTLGGKRVGNKVNLEVDLVARYLEALLRPFQDEAVKADLSLEFLAKHGYV